MEDVVQLAEYFPYHALSLGFIPALGRLAQENLKYIATLFFIVKFEAIMAWLHDTVFPKTGSKESYKNITQKMNTDNKSNNNTNIFCYFPQAFMLFKKILK